jgi:starvation-inducible DNA-binding protein
MSTHAHETRNKLETNAKAVAIELLNARLADTIDLALVAKQAHWNVKGRTFIGVHKMLDELRDDVDEYVDLIAERVTALGGTALGTSQIVVRSSTVEPYPVDIYKVEDHLRALADRYGRVANAVRANIDDADEAGDADTADLFTEVSRGLDKWLWFIEAHLQE